MPEIASTQKVDDCLHRVRYQYWVSSPITKDILQTFSDQKVFSVQTYDVTHILPHAKVPFKIQHREGSVLISGAFGLDYLTVTYAKDDELDGAIARMEEMIRCLP